VVLVTFIVASALLLVQTDAPQKPTAAAPPEARAPAPADDAAKNPDGNDAHRKAAAKILMPDLMLLTALAILLLFLGGILFIRRMGEQVSKNRPRKPVRYFDMKVEPPSEPPPHEPSADERLKDRS
jgi:hypothetical protein